MAGQAGPTIQAGVSRRQVEGRHMGRHIIQNRIGYSLLREKKKRRETEKDPREGHQEGTDRI